MKSVVLSEQQLDWSRIKSIRFSDSDNYTDYVLTDTSANKDGDEVATFQEIFS
jgi:hypothetical protein